MVDLSNSQHWIKVFEESYQAQPRLIEPNKYERIPLIRVPNIFDVHLLAISCFVANTKPRWRYGGNVYQTIQTAIAPGIAYFSDNKSYALKINDTTKIQLDKLSPTYKLIVDLPKWFREVSIVVWAFMGDEPLLETNELIEAVRDDLSRIENKLDSMNT